MQTTHIVARKSERSHQTVATWAKRCYLAGRIAMEAALRPYQLGVTQWYVLYQLTENGPTMQRDLLRILHIERATLSIVVASMVRKGLIEQVPDRIDKRQKLLKKTPTGTRLWHKLPDLEFIHKIAFDDIHSADIATAVNVLRTATQRLETFSRKRADS